MPPATQAPPERTARPPQGISVLGPWALAALLAASAAVAADTAQDFDSPGTAYELGQHANPPPAQVLAGGPTGNFLRLAVDTASPPVINTVDFARTHLGPACQVSAGFDFRIVPGSGRADGLGMALLSTGAYRAAGVEPPPQPFFVPEEPSFERSLGFGFDVYQNPEPEDVNDNHVSVHFDGQVVSQVDAGVDLASGGWVHAEIDVDLLQATVTVVLTPAAGAPVIVLADFPVPELAPYESRVHLGARSGGLAADHDVDNVEVTFNACPPELVGQWSEVLPWPVVAIHAHLLPTGEVLFWDRHDLADGDARAPEQAHKGLTGAADTMPRLWNPVTGQLRLAALPPTGYDLFCSGHAFLPSGLLLVAGGHVLDNVGLPSAAVYDAFADAWTRLPDMREGRWYPTNTTLANGDVLVMSGSVDCDDLDGDQKCDPEELVGNLTPEVWHAGPGSWRSLTTAQLGLPFYPYMYLMPDGRACTFGPQSQARCLDTGGTGAWSNLPASGLDRDYGSSVLYGDGKVLIVGGGLAPTAGAQVIDLTQQAPAWSETGAMTFPRRQLNATLLPDGSVLATGGTSAAGFNDATGAVYAAELWDPASGEWTPLAAMAETRIYHSTALLLPDGRVLSAGGGHPSDAAHGDGDHYNAEIYSPPYLFRGPRPAVTAAPAQVVYGETFQVATPDAASVAAVSWLRLGSVTHAFNQNQRINRLELASVAGGLEVAAPASATLCPPGHYMLFLVNGAGVPSVGRLIWIAPAPPFFADGFESGDTTAWSAAVGGSA